MRLDVLWQEGKPPDSVSDVGQLDRLLDGVADTTPRDRLNCVLFQSPDGSELSLVLGSHQTVVGWNGVKGDPPYYASAGDDIDTQSDMTCFLMGVHHTEFPRKSVITIDKGREAVREFFLTGTRPTCIQWEEV